MAVPDFQSLMLPLLRRLADGRPHAYGEVREALALELAISPEDRALRLPSGKQTVFHNRFGWAKTHLSKAGLLESPSRGILQLSAAGQVALSTARDRLTMADLRHYPCYLDFLGEAQEGQPDSRVAVATVPCVPEASLKTPDEAIDELHAQMRHEIEAQLIEQIKGASPQFFEQLVIDLLLKMGYGGSREDAGEAIGKSGDGGIDGIIKEDRLGLDAIYLQAKRWQGTVGRPDIQGFAGSLHGVRARKGVFITTSQFSAEAREYVSRIDLKIVLIDGHMLARLMFDYGLGVSTVKAYEVKRVDSDYFQES